MPCSRSSHVLTNSLIYREDVGSMFLQIRETFAVLDGATSQNSSEEKVIPLFIIKPRFLGISALSLVTVVI
jgi:hypothetical protein